MESLIDLARRANDRSDVSKTVALAAGQYTAGQVMGGVITLNNTTGPLFEEAGLSNILQGVTVFDQDVQNAQIDLFFFNQALTGTATDNATFAPTAADMSHCIAVVNIPSADYVGGGTMGSIAAGKNQTNLGRVIKPSRSATTPALAVYCVPVSRSTATYATRQLIIRFQFSNGL